MSPPAMVCHLCGRAAHQVCTVCGRPFCPGHGGLRLYCEGSGQGGHVVTRALCDDDTPNQWFLANRYLVLLPTVAAVALVINFGCIQPGKERRDREWHQKVQEQHRDHQEFRRRAAFDH